MDTGDRMLCHACGGVWIKNDDLTCPHCESDFTEIVQLRFPQNCLLKVPPYTVPTPRRLRTPTRGWITTHGNETHKNGRALGFSEVGLLHIPRCAPIDRPTAVFHSAAQHLILECLLVSAIMARTLWFR
ncbi:hypothetical protein ACN42_g5995 [Penicillium freii]|uniref:Uncharacterized protein n=1 Tax=Penicillium freii TaxID=48697 RepID=A0A101MIB4_PENFR|nr:hypothetical protein ACN42_g5995 [Penicillium freii]